MIIWSLCLLLATPGEVRLTAAFDGADATPPILSQYGRDPGPILADGALTLLDATPSQQNVAAWPRLAPGLYRRTTATLRLRLNDGADGCGIAWLNVDEFGADGPGPLLTAWEEPNLKGSFAVGFDIYNPPTDNPFNADGNIHGRPAREVSLHWDGVEVANTLSPVEFRDGRWHDVAIDLTWLPGGGEVTVTIDGRAIYDRRFVPLLTAYESRPALGARSGAEVTRLALDDLTVTWSDPFGGYPQPLARQLLDGVVCTAQAQLQTAELDLPELAAARLVLTLTLSAPDGGIDAWDRSGALYVWEGDRRTEILRFITPFGRGYTWHADVSDYAPLLRGRRRVGVWIDTWRNGWRVEAELRWFPGRPDREVTEVRTLWAGQWEYGNPADPLVAHLPTRLETIPAGTASARLRLMVTGHGMHPATRNAAEFMPADRTVTVNGREYANRLWKTDGYLNPCRPQGGTWKYDRAGWAPGSVVEPWVIELPEPPRELVIDYRPMDYVNEARDKARATHWIEAQLILYRRAAE